MKKTAMIALSALLVASTSLSAFAQGGPDAPQQKRQPASHQQKNEQPHGQPQRAEQKQAHDNRAPSGHQQQANNNHQPNDFRQGRALPTKYRGAGYQVNDWKKRGLKAPPSGHRWVKVDGNFLLIAAATGVIASVIAHQ